MKFYICLVVVFCLVSCRSSQSVSDVLLDVPVAEKEIKVDGDGKDWDSKPLVLGLTAPWNGPIKDSTVIYICHDKKNLYFLFKIKDDNLIYDDREGEEAVNYRDRAEIFLSKDEKLSTYFCAEIDPQAKVLDYEAHFYRDFNFEWDFKQLIVASQLENDGYVVEGALPIEWLKSSQLLSDDGEMFIGLYRANAIEPENDESIVWCSWIVPDSKDPDFHIPSSLGKLRLQ